MKRIVFRGDDAGSCIEANEAVEQAALKGVLRNASVMACGPTLEDAARRLSGIPGLAIGWHFCLNSEWVEVKWGPVAPVSDVPSLVDKKGHFLPFPKDLRERDAVLEEMILEASAQLERMRHVGLEPVYMDEHMGVGWLPGLREALCVIADREGLLVSSRVKFTAHPDYSSPESDSEMAENWLHGLSKVSDGDALIVTHPGVDREGSAMRRFYLAGDPADGKISQERDAERLALCHPGLPIGLQKLGWESVTYLDL